MKKLLTSTAVAAICAGSAYGQGTVLINVSTGNFNTYTNTSQYSTADNGVYNKTGGLTAKTANGFFYQLLVQNGADSVASLGNGSADPLSGSWTVPAFTAVNGTTFAGSLVGTGGASGAAVTPWAQNIGNSYNTVAANGASSVDYFLIVGWSANLGATWSTVSTELANNSWVANGFFGVSQLGLGGAGGNSPLNAASLFGTTASNPTMLTQGLTLFDVSPTPEPGTMALAALGGASLLLFRRRK